MWQHVIVLAVLGICIILAVRYFIKEWRENVRYKNYGCAGCAFYDRCKRNKKIPNLNKQVETAADANRKG